MHMYLSAVLSQVRQELLKFVDELVSDTKSPRQRIDSVSKIWELRIASLWRLEGYWFLDEVREIETPERRLLDDVVISCGIERDWNSVSIRC